MSDGNHDLLKGEGLFYEVIGPEPCCLYSDLDGAVARHHDNRELGEETLQAVKGFNPVYPRHPYVEEDQVGKLIGCPGNPAFSIRGGKDLESLILQRTFKGGPDALLVVYDKYGLCHYSPRKCFIPIPTPALPLKGREISSLSGRGLR